MLANKFCIVLGRVSVMCHV